MALPEFSLRQLLEAGAHFGHNTHRWNPKMNRYIFGKRNNIHILDLAQTVPLLHQALITVSDTVANGGRVLFVGTKRQASEVICDAAKKSAQYYVNHRWLGGTLTNWSTISNSIKRLRKLEEILAGAEAEQLTKKERLMLSREHDKLERALGGIKDMGGTPDLMFVIDTNKEKNAVDEARRLKIPVVAVLDTNCDPDMVNHPIPGNDDASRAIALYCDLIAKAALDGIARQQGSAGVDIGEAAETPVEEALDAAATEAPTEEPKAEEPPTEDAKAEEVVAEAVVEEPKAEEAPAEAKPEEKPAEEAPKAEEAPVEEPKADEAPAEEAKAEEKPAAKATEEKPADDAPLFTKPEGEPDDLKKISGVGPVLEAKLHDLGITQFAQVAAFTEADIARVDDRLNFKGRIERDDWIKQAKELAKG